MDFWPRLVPLGFESLLIELLIETELSLPVLRRLLGCFEFDLGNLGLRFLLFLAPSLRVALFALAWVFSGAF